MELLRLAGPPLAGGIVVLTALWSLVGFIVVGSRLDRWDTEVSESVARHRRPLLDTLTGIFTWPAESLTVAVLWVLIGILLAVTTRHWVGPLLLSVALAGEKCTYLFSSLIVDRDRPPVPTLGHLYATSSWPSGHVASAVTLYGSVALLVLRYRPRWPVAVRTAIVALPIVIALLVAASRWYRGVHYVSDVAAGFVLGLAWLAVAAAIVGRAEGRMGR
jgi:undecaprenyl-diphosphatase